MKKIIAFTLMLTMCVSLMAGCGEQAQNTQESKGDSAASSDLASAKDYINTMYKNKASTHMEDFEVVGKVMIGETAYEVEWTADSDTVKFEKNDNGMVKVDIDEKNPEEVTFNLTATISDDKGNKETVSFPQKVPAAILLDAGMSYEEIVEAAYKLQDGLDLGSEQTLFGKIVKIDSPYSAEYKNISVVIQIGELADKPILCYRLSGEGVENLKEGDEITVKGLLKNYKGTIEFDKGCQLVGMGEKKDQSPIVEAAYKLEDGMSMPESVTLTGVISKIDTPYSAEYKNITVIITVDGIEDKPIMCYRLSGEGADKLSEGDTITVTGTIKNYKGTIEFDKGCTLDAKA